MNYIRSDNGFEYSASHSNNSCNSVSQRIDNANNPQSRYIAPIYYPSHPSGSQNQIKTNLFTHIPMANAINAPGLRILHASNESEFNNIKRNSPREMTLNAEEVPLNLNLDDESIDVINRRDYSTPSYYPISNLENGIIFMSSDNAHIPEIVNIFPMIYLKKSII